MIGYYGSGMASVWDGNEKLGPYADAVGPSTSSCSRSLPPLGGLLRNLPRRLEPGGGRPGPQPRHPADTADPGHRERSPRRRRSRARRPSTTSRTSTASSRGPSASTSPASWWRPGSRTTTTSLPDDLKAGAIAEARDALLLAGTGGRLRRRHPPLLQLPDLPHAPGRGAGLQQDRHVPRPQRSPVPRHDGRELLDARGASNTMDAQGDLILGGGLTPRPRTAEIPRRRGAGSERARTSTDRGGAVGGRSPEEADRVVESHRPQAHHRLSRKGRRMWLNVQAGTTSSDATLLREDGAYGPLFDGARADPVEVIDPADGQPVQVLVASSIPHDGNTKRVRGALRHDPGMGEPARSSRHAGTSLALGYDRNHLRRRSSPWETSPAQAPGTRRTRPSTSCSTMRCSSDNRIPPWRMSYDEARVRNALPVPADQYGDPGTGRLLRSLRRGDN